MAFTQSNKAIIEFSKVTNLSRITIFWLMTHHWPKSKVVSSWQHANVCPWTIKTDRKWNFCLLDRRLFMFVSVDHFRLHKNVSFMVGTVPTCGLGSKLKYPVWFKPWFLLPFLVYLLRFRLTTIELFKL